MDHIEDPRNVETGVLRVQREMERAERRRLRWQKNAVITAIVGSGFVITLVVSIVAGLGRSSASARGLAPAKAAPKVALAREPIVDPGTEAEPSGPVPAEGPAGAATRAVTAAAPVPAVEPKPAPKIASKPKPSPGSIPKEQGSPAAQHFRIRIGGTGYEPSVITASAGRPITLTVGKGEGCAAGFLMPKLGVNKDNSSGPVTFKLGRLEPGTYGFSCGMGMVQGQLVVR